MTKQLPPPGMTEHLQWKPNTGQPSTKKELIYEIIDIVTYGKEVFGPNLEQALQNVINYTRDFNAGVISAPALIGAKSIAPPTHRFWQKSYCVRSTEIYGVDTNGIFGNKCEPVLVVLHGEGIEPIQFISFQPGSNFNHMRQSEFDTLLKEHKLRNGKYISLYTLDAITTIPPKIYDTFGVVLNDAQARSFPELICRSFNMFNSPLNIARAGGSTHLRNYYDRIPTFTNEVTLENPYTNIAQPDIPQIRPLELQLNAFVRTVRGPDYTYVVYEGRQ